MFVGITIHITYGISGNELPPPIENIKKTAQLIDVDTGQAAHDHMAVIVMPMREVADKICKPYSVPDRYQWEVIELAQDTPTAADYKTALNAAMLYVQSVVYDVNHGTPAPSERSQRLLSELTGNHGETIKSLAAELNDPPK